MERRTERASRSHVIRINGIKILKKREKKYLKSRTGELSVRIARAQCTCRVTFRFFIVDKCYISAVHEKFDMIIFHVFRNLNFRDFYQIISAILFEAGRMGPLEQEANPMGEIPMWLCFASPLD